MRPRKLVIEGLRSYRQRQEITFTDGLFAITGQTGSGKSSILEAMVFALYGASTFDARNPKVLLSDRCDEMTVSLEFLLRRERYQVTRCFSASGRNSMHELKGPKGEILASKSQEVDRAIEELLGLRCEDFLKTVVLPQGAFQSLLHSTPSQRTPLLKNLLGLFQLDELAERVAEEKQRLSALVQVGRVQRQQLPLQPEKLAEQLRQEREAAASAQQLLEEHLNQLSALEQLGRDGEQHLAERERRLAWLQGLQWPTAQQWDELAAAELELQVEERELLAEEDRLQRAQRDLQALEKSRPELEPTRLRSWERRQQALLQRHALSEQERLRADQELEALEEARAGLQRLEREAHCLVEGLEQAQGQLAQAQIELSEAEAQGRYWQELEGRRQLAQEQVTVLGRQAEAQLEALGQVESELERLGAALEQLRQLVARREADLHQAERNSGLNALCSDVSAGELCPLCARELPADWHVPPAEGVEEARQALRQAQLQLRHSDQAWAQAFARGEMLRQQGETLARELSQRRAELGALPADLPVALEAAHRLLSQARERHQEITLRATGLSTEVEMGRKTLERERRQLAQLEQRWREGQTRQADEAQQLERLQRQLCEELGAVEWPTGVEQLLAQWETELEALEVRRREGQSQGQGLQQRRLAYQAERVRRLERPFEQVRSALHNCFARLESSGGAPGPAPAPDWSLAQWLEAARAWGAVSDLLQQELRSQLEQQRQQFLCLQERLRGLLASLGRDSLESLRRDLDDKKQAVWQLEHRLTLLERDRQRLNRLNMSLEPAEQRLAQLEAVHELLGNKSGKDRRLSFTQWVLQQRQEQLLRLASQTFQQVSAGQFGFAADFQILDMQSGLERKPATLSGGECFLASLALALSLSELVARRGGRLEAFFIDEGFGSLSPECLDRAMTALEVLAQNGRMIGVISHVALMAERIEQVWMVSKTPTGSRIEILSEELRKRLLEADVRAFESANHPLFAMV